MKERVKNLIWINIVLISIFLSGFIGYYIGSSDSLDEDFFDEEYFAYGTIKEIRENVIILESESFDTREIVELTISINEETKIIKYDYDEINGSEEFVDPTETILELNDLKIGDYISVESIGDIKDKTEINAYLITLEDFENI